jgi:hypothetical protein
MPAADPHRRIWKNLTSGSGIGHARPRDGGDDMLAQFRTGAAKNMSHDLAAAAP